jgi:hypothetical protein
MRKSLILQVTSPLWKEFFVDMRYENARDELCKNENFDDMVAIVTAASQPWHRKAAATMIKILSTTTATQLSNSL